MTLKWCVLTGALMIAFVCATFMYKNAVQNPPGVYTRWYDGTTERVDKFYLDGKLLSTTTYGDDGKTVLVLVELNTAGAITHSKVRGADGKVEEKSFSEDGKTLLVQTLWNGEETFFLAQREFYDNGKLHDAVTMTEDGTVATNRVVYDQDGNLELEVHVQTNADQDARMYKKGKLFQHQLFKANGDRITEIFFKDTEIVSRRETVTALTKEVVSDCFSRDGTLVYRLAKQTPRDMVISVFAQGKLATRQTLQNFAVTLVEEFTAGSDTPTLKVELDEFGRINTVSYYRTDGTLLRVKQLHDSVVVSQEDYDASGTKVIRKQAGGEAEHLDPKWLVPVTPPIQEERGQGQ